MVNHFSIQKLVRKTPKHLPQPGNPGDAKQPA